ncbi:MAG: glycosyl hydrolase family 57 [Planctomycetes bacterium]|nr:glycosyl hydrolase family 57 [Planctomycetota bacterium]
MITQEMPATISGLPNICGDEETVAGATCGTEPVYLTESDIDFGSIQSAFAIALHMQQPLIPAGGGDLQKASIISNLKYMMEHLEIQDNHNASVFHWCYKRMGEFIPQLVAEGKSPRVLLDYSGCLLYGLVEMGLTDVIDSLRQITTDPTYRRYVEWMGCTWSHAVAPSTPVQDFRLHVKAWQHYFAALFGLEALQRVKGFSPAEMALPNHPEVFYEFVKTLKEAGYWWVLVQEHTIEDPETGNGITNPHLPHRLVARNSQGEELSIIAIIKTQGSDTKLVAQMQPYYEAKTLSRVDLAGQSIPLLVTQIGDGENGGVMMNEFPGVYQQAISEASHSQTPALNVTEYLEYLMSLGITENDFPAVQPVMQKRIWDTFTPGGGVEKLEACIRKIEKDDNTFHMEGGSWTNNISWVEGYENVLGPMNTVSAAFAEKVLKSNASTSEHRYRNALFYLLLTQTSCYRYWGQGIWTAYARELCRRAMAIINNDF